MMYQRLFVPSILLSFFFYFECVKNFELLLAQLYKTMSCKHLSASFRHSIGSTNVLLSRRFITLMMCACVLKSVYQVNLLDGLLAKAVKMLAL